MRVYATIMAIFFGKRMIHHESMAWMGLQQLPGPLRFQRRPEEAIDLGCP